MAVWLGGWVATPEWLLLRPGGGACADVPCGCAVWLFRVWRCGCACVAVPVCRVCIYLRGYVCVAVPSALAGSAGRIYAWVKIPIFKRRTNACVRAFGFLLHVFVLIFIFFLSF